MPGKLGRGQLQASARSPAGSATLQGTGALPGQLRAPGMGFPLCGSLASQVNPPQVNAPLAQGAEECREDQSTTKINHPLGTEPYDRPGEAQTWLNSSPVLREFAFLCPHSSISRVLGA